MSFCALYYLPVPISCPLCVFLFLRTLSKQITPQIKAAIALAPVKPLIKSPVPGRLPLQSESIISSSMPIRGQLLSMIQTLSVFLYQEQKQIQTMSIYSDTGVMLWAPPTVIAVYNLANHCQPFSLLCQRRLGTLSLCVIIFAEHFHDVVQ